MKNKGLLEIIEKIEKIPQEASCDNCKYCDLNAYHSGRWYCRRRSVLGESVKCPLQKMSEKEETNHYMKTRKKALLKGDPCLNAIDGK